MKAIVKDVSSWRGHAPAKVNHYSVKVKTETGKEIIFIKDATNAPPLNLWEGEEVEVVWRKHKDDDLVLPFII